MADLEVTEVQIKLAQNEEDKLLGYCSLTLNNAFVVKDVKLIQGDNAIFVAMPSRKLADKCPHCGGKNHLRAKFCNDCGKALNPDRAEADSRGRARLHFDLVHPVRADVREYLNARIIEAYHAERARGT